MHFYKFNIGDYRRDTVHLSRSEHGLYRDLIDWYYLDEAPIPLETHLVSRRLRLTTEDDATALKNVLADFFVLTDTGYRHPRIDADIAAYHAECAKNHKNGKKGGRPKSAKPLPGKAENPVGSESVTTGIPSESQINPNQKPLTNNQKPLTNKPLKPVVEYSPEFDQAWSAYPSRPGVSKKEAFKAWKARIAEGVDPLKLIDGVVRYASYCVACGTDPNYVKQPTTFFGPGEHYLSDWTPPVRASPSWQDKKQANEDATNRAIRDFGAGVQAKPALVGSSA